MGIKDEMWKVNVEDMFSVEYSRFNISTAATYMKQGEGK
jgi:hypothetical protein